MMYLDVGGPEDSIIEEALLEQLEKADVKNVDVDIVLHYL